MKRRTLASAVLMRAVHVVRRISRISHPASRAALITLLFGVFYLTAGPVRASVTLVSFTATGGVGEILLRWETATEIDSAGFFIWRSEAEAGEYERVSPFVPAQGDGLIGAVYTYVDRAVETGMTYYYKLEAVDNDQSTQFHGPVSATLGAAATATPTATETRSATTTVTLTATVLPTHTPTLTRTPTSTPSRTPTTTPETTFAALTSTPTKTPPSTLTTTPAPSPTPQPTKTWPSTSTPPPTATPRPTATPTVMPSATPTASHTLVPTQPPALTATLMPAFTSTVSPAPTAEAGASSEPAASTTASQPTERASQVTPTPTASSTHVTVAPTRASSRTPVAGLTKRALPAASAPVSETPADGRNWLVTGLFGLAALLGAGWLSTLRRQGADG